MGIGLSIDLIGVLLLSYERPTRKKFKEERKKRNKIMENVKSGKHRGTIPMYRIDKDIEERIISNQYNYGIFLIIIGFLLQLASVLSQLIG